MIQIDLHKQLKSASNKFELELKFEIKQGDFVSIYGKSGAGKTTFLKLLAGLEKPSSGKITVFSNNWFDSEKKINKSPQERKIGFVFQDFALFPNMTVKQNLEYALLKNQTSEIIEELLEMMELKEIQDQKPASLSGGQKQRTALARALVQQPSVLLLDEPLSALDREMRKKLQNYLLKVHHKYKLTTFLVSHNLAEVFKLSDTVICVEKGQVLRIGSPETIFTNNSELGRIQMIGEILSIKKVENKAILQISSEDLIHKVTISEEELKDLEVGDQICIQSTFLNSSLEKI